MSCKIGIIGPSDLSSFKKFGVGPAQHLFSDLEQLCNFTYRLDPIPSLAVVPYKGIPVEVAKMYSILGGKVFGIYDNSLNNSSNFARNKLYCTELIKCPSNVNIDDFYVNFVDIIIAFGISFGTMKEILSNHIPQKRLFLLTNYITSFPKELINPCNVKPVKSINELFVNINLQHF